MRFISNALLSTFFVCTISTGFAEEAAESSEPVVSPEVNLPSDVESDGAFRYRIDLDLPEFRGLVPNLSLRYSSSNRSNGSPDATMGVGWSLAGLSSIDRVSAGLGIPTYTGTDDIFRLDGTALMACKDAAATAPWDYGTTVIPGTPPVMLGHIVIQPGTPDRTVENWAYPGAFHTTMPSASCSAGGNLAAQQENYLRVLRIGDDTATNSRFEVTRPDGTQMIYRSVGELAGETGVPSNPHFDPAFRRLWLLSEIRDTQTTTNVVTVTYDFASGADGYAHRVKSLTYADYAVEFHYKPMNTPLATYSVGRTGFFGRQFHELTSITVREGTTQIRAYDLDYTSSTLTGARLLSAVTQYGSDYGLAGSEITGGTALPPTAFSYSQDSYGLTEQLYPGHTFNTSAAVWDFNDDQRQDIVVPQMYYLGIDHDEGPDTPDVTLPKGHFGFDAARNISTLPNGWIPNALDYQFNPTLEPKNAILGIWSSSSSEGGKFILRQSVTARENDHGDWRYNYDVHLERIAHDGNVSSTQRFSGLGLSLDASFVQLYPSQRSEITLDHKVFSIGSDNKAHQIADNFLLLGQKKRADLDGDGLTEFITSMFNNSNLSAIRILEFKNGNLSHFDYLSNSITGNCGAITLTKGDFYFGDVNGDGSGDLLHYKPNGHGNDQICVALSSGWGFGSYDVWANLPNLFLTNTSHHNHGSDFGKPVVSITDVNDDGTGDVVVWPNPRNGLAFERGTLTPGDSHIFLSTGHSFVSASQGTVPAYVTLGDFDGDGRLDFASMKGEPVWPGSPLSNAYSPGARVYWGPSSSPNLLTSISLPEGGGVDVTYRPSSDFAGNLVPGVSQVVGSIARSDGRGTVRTTDYTYVGSRYDYERRKPLGFRTVSAQLEPIAGESVGPTIVTTYLNDHPAEYGLVKSRTVMVDGTTTYEFRVNDWDVQLAGNGPWRATKTRERVSMRYGSDLIETMRSFTYTPFGQPAVTVDYGFSTAGADAAPGDNTTVTLEYQPNLSAYIVDRPSVKRIEAGTASSMAQSNWLSAEFYHYDGAGATTPPARGNLSEVRVWAGDPSNLNSRLQAAFTHDAWGNVLTETNARGATTTHAYDATRHLFRVSSTNALSHSGTTVWQTGCQAPASQTDANGLVTTFSYDVLCREISRAAPNGWKQETFYVNLGDATAQYIEKKSRSSSNGTAYQYTITRDYFDGLGQVWKSVAPGSRSDLETYGVVELNGYDARGNLAWTSLPRLFPEGDTVTAAQKTTFFYDALNRPLRTIFADGSETRTDYRTAPLNRWGAVINIPRVRQRDAHCFDAASENTLCGERWDMFDAAGRVVRSDRRDEAVTDVGATTPARSEHFIFDRLGRLTGVTTHHDGVWTYTYDVFGNRLTADDPGLGYWTMAYDENGNLTQQTDAKGQIIAFTYDALDRVTLKQVGTGPDRVETTYGYDEPRGNNAKNIGQLTTQTVTQSGSQTHQILKDYNNQGLVHVERHEVDGRSYQIMYGYSLPGQLNRIYLPNQPGGTGGAWINGFGFDAANRVTRINGLINSITYDLWGNPTETVFANGVRETGLYDPQRGWPLRLSAFAPDGVTRFLDTVYTRSATGRITRADTETPEGDLDYTYDYAGRLLSATNFSGQTAFDQSFTYDAVGRMRSNSRVGTYSYLSNGPLHAPNQIYMAGGGTEVFSYDANGNMLTGLNGKVMTYDGENRPLSVTHAGKTTSYVYGADGTRLKKIENVGTPQETTTLYLGLVEIRNFLSGSEQILTYPIPAVRMVDGVISYLHRDALSSVRAVTGADGAVDETAVYRPFGEQHEQIQDLSAAGEDKGFIGERYDADAGLQYLNARYYDPELAMFIQPDWWEVTQPSVGTNRYSYSFNDPVNKLDPGGNESVVVSGSEGDEDHAVDEHFLENGYDRALSQKAVDENTTWIIHDGLPGSDHNSDIDAYVVKATRAGITVVRAGSTEDIIDYINNKTGDSPRRSDPIGYFSYVGHGFGAIGNQDGILGPGAYLSGSQYHMDSPLSVSRLDPRAFSSNAHVNLLATCNAATPSSNGKGVSVVEQFSRILSPRASVSGYIGTVDFYTSGVDTDYELGQVTARQERLGGWLPDYTVRTENRREMIVRSGTK